MLVIYIRLILLIQNLLFIIILVWISIVLDLIETIILVYIIFLFILKLILLKEIRLIILFLLYFVLYNNLLWILPIAYYLKRILLMFFIWFFWHYPCYFIIKLIKFNYRLSKFYFFFFFNWFDRFLNNLFILFQPWWYVIIRLTNFLFLFKEIRTLYASFFVPISPILKNSMCIVFRNHTAIKF